MGSFSVYHFLIVGIYAVCLVVPFWKIFKRTGIPPALSLLAFIPIVPIIFLWVVATKRWPQDEVAPAVRPA